MKEYTISILIQSEETTASDIKKMVKKGLENGMVFELPTVKVKGVHTLTLWEVDEHFKKEGK